MAKKKPTRLGRPSEYDKPHRTTIMQSDLVRNKLLPDLVRWIGASKNNIVEKAVREFHRQEKERRGL